MLCGGTTVYSPLKKYGAGTTAKDVGVIGIGGLGHFALIFAKAMGANVTAISHSANKEQDAKKMGATNFIVTGDDAAAAVKGKERSLDLIICSSSKSLPPPICAAWLTCRRQEDAARGLPYPSKARRTFRSSRCPRVQAPRHLPRSFDHDKHPPRWIIDRFAQGYSRSSRVCRQAQGQGLDHQV